MAAAAGNSKLPKKELELFRSVVNCYETKQYRKGIKNAEQILKKFPNHGETLAMKGLIYNSTDKKEEAYELIKLGLKNDVRSHTCWHVYGLIHKSDSNYKEASKCYLNALRIDPNNQNILRDLSWLQIQMRDLAGFMKSRRTILDSKASLRASWVSYAVATYLAGEYSIAQVVIDKYFESVADGTVDKYEESELLLFQNQCFEKQGLYVEGIAHLEKHEAAIVDKLGLKVKIAEYLLRLGRYAEAKEKWMALCLSQTENYRFHCGLQAAYLEIDTNQCDKVFALKRLELPCTTLTLHEEQQKQLREMYQSNPKLVSSRAVSKIQLSLASNVEELRPLLDAHCKKCLRDGVPALYHDVCYLIRKESAHDASVMFPVSEMTEFRSHPIAMLAIELVSSYVANLKSVGSFDDTSSSDKEEPPCLLWTMFLHAHLLECSGFLSQALAVIDECIEHTPTALDMQVRRARIQKKLGLVVDASATMDSVRALDLQDRYLNNKATKYYLRADNIPQAMDTIAMFTKHDGDPQQYLYDMQCNWYELELAESYARQHKWGLALKKFYAIQSHFKDYVEDMFDFHNYAQTRKTTLRMYADALNMQDNIYAHKFYQRAARGSLAIFLYLLDNPDDMDGLSHLPVAERRKERAKLKKRRAKEEKEEAKSATAASSANADEKAKKVDLDPLGEKILQKNLLQEATNFCNLLSSRLKSCDPSTLAFVAEVQLRRSKLVQAARAISCGLAQCKEHPDLIVMLVKLYRRVKGQDGSPAPVLAEPIMAALTSELSSAMNGLDAAAFVSQAVDRATASNCIIHRIGAGRLLIATSTHKGLGPAKQRAADLLLEECTWTGKGVKIANVDAAHKYLRYELKNESAAEAFRIRALQTFPNATVLQAIAADSGAENSEDGPDEPAV